MACFTVPLATAVAARGAKLPKKQRAPTMGNPTNILRRGRSPFTLVELLVVIAIIAILAGMLSPSLVSAMKRARDISCKSNLKQCMVAMLSYVYDTNYYVAHYRTIPGHPDGEWRFWSRELEYTGYLPDLGNDIVRKMTRGVQVCPEHPMTESDGTPKSRLTSSYGAVWAKAKDDARNINDTANVRANEPDYPSRRIWLADCTGAAIEAGFEFHPKKLKNVFVQAYGQTAEYNPLLIHFSKANAAFVDGHVAGIGPEYIDTNVDINAIAPSSCYMKFATSWYERTAVPYYSTN